MLRAVLDFVLQGVLIPSSLLGFLSVADVRFKSGLNCSDISAPPSLESVADCG